MRNLWTFMPFCVDPESLSGTSEPLSVEPFCGSFIWNLYVELLFGTLECLCVYMWDHYVHLSLWNLCVWKLYLNLSDTFRWDLCLKLFCGTFMWNCMQKLQRETLVGPNVEPGNFKSFMWDLRQPCARFRASCPKPPQNLLARPQALLLGVETSYSTLGKGTKPDKPMSRPADIQTQRPPPGARWKLCDFNLACEFVPSEAMCDYAGTRPYMAPEVVDEHYTEPSTAKRMTEGWETVVTGAHGPRYFSRIPLTGQKRQLWSEYCSFIGIGSPGSPFNFRGL